MRALAVTLAVLLVAAGCGGSDSPPVPRQDDREVIRGWLAALNAGDYVAAASYFAKGAVVEQRDEFRLRNREEAEAFNRSLPCNAELTDVDDKGRTTLAAFRLRAGPGGPCHGTVKVRFTIEGGKVREWRQLPQQGPGDVV